MMELSPFVFRFLNPGKNYACLLHTISLKKYYFPFEKYRKVLSDIKKGKDTEIIKKLKEDRFLVEDLEEEKRFFINKVRRIARELPLLKHASYIVVTDECNLRCKYCFFEGNISRFEGPITERDVDFIVNKIRKLSEKTKEFRVIFYGGEPLLYPKIVFEIVDSLSDLKNVRFSVITNGCLINKNLAKEMKKRKISVGLSMDGDLYSNKLRVYPDGKEVFWDSLRALSILKKEGVRVSVSCTISRENVHRLPKIVEFFWNLGINSIGFNIMLRTKSNNPFIPNPKITAYFLFKAFKRCWELGIYEDRIWRRRWEHFISESFRFFDCPAMSGGTVDFYKGIWGPCQAFFTVKRYIKEQREEIDELYKEFRKCSPVFNDGCILCEAVGICGGCCPFDIYIKEGGIFGVNRNFCVIMKEMLRYLIDFYYENFVSLRRIRRASECRFEDIEKLMEGMTMDKEVKNFMDVERIKDVEDFIGENLRNEEMGSGGMYIIFHKEEPVGWANLVPIDPFRKVFEVGIYIKKDFRRKGFGRMLIEEIIREARKKGFNLLVARIKKGNESSKKFFESLGFRRLKFEKDKEIYVRKP